MRTIVLIALLIAATYAYNHNGNDMLLISGLTMGTTYSVKIKNDNKTVNKKNNDTSFIRKQHVVVNRAPS